MLLAAGLALGLSAAVPAAGEAAPLRCHHLRGHRVVSTGSLLVARVHFDRIYRRGGTRVIGNELLGCARPRGVVYRLASTYREYIYPGSTRTEPIDSGAAFVGQTAGPFLTLRTQAANLTGDYAEKTYVVLDTRTGRRYRFFHALMSPAGATRPEPGPPLRTVLNARGQLAGIFAPNDRDGFVYSEPGHGQVEVVAYGLRGNRLVLDRAPASRIPTSSLSLRGSTVSWIDGGTRRSAIIR